MIFRCLTLIFCLSCIFFSAFSQFGDVNYITYEGITSDRSVSFDIDNDGDIDIARIGFRGEAFGWYENDGTGNFGALNEINCGSQMAQLITAGDLDNDGLIDVITASNISDRVVWFKNMGGNGFVMRETLIEDSYPNDLKVIDIDGDNDLDILYANVLGPIVIENLGGGIFDFPAVVNSPYITRSVHAADGDGDGDLDIFSTTLDGVVVFFNSGGLAFDSSNVILDTLQGTVWISTFDIDTDGDLDLVTSSSVDDNLSWYENTGNATFINQEVISNTSDDPRFHLLDDMDNDGDLDIILTSGADNTVAWYENLGTAQFGAEQVIADTITGINFVNSADYDLDGNTDILTLYPLTIFNNQLGSFTSTNLVRIDNGPSFSLAGDFDNDGDQDIATASLDDGIIAWHDNLGNGIFGAKKVISSNLDEPIYLISEDIDNDGDLDIFTASRGDGRVTWNENLGGGNFGSDQVISSSTQWVTSIQTMDIDGDGDVDLAASSGDLDRVDWFENLGGGSFSSAQLLINVDSPTEIVFVDFDLDNDLDMVVSSAASWADVNWYENQGGGSFVLTQTMDITGSNCLGIDADDLTGNGYPDLVAVLAAGNRVIFLENLNGTFAAEVILSDQLAYPKDVHLSDYDNDSDLDILIAERGGKVSSIENMGSSSFAPIEILMGSLSSTYTVITSDLDMDGDLDPIITDYGGLISPDPKVIWIENETIMPWRATGKVFVDVSQNGIIDSVDTGINPAMIITTPTNSFAYSDNNGDYTLDFNNSAALYGTYQLAPDSLPGWGLTTDSSYYTFTLNSASLFKDSLDFGYYPVSAYDSINCELTGGFARCNDTVLYTLSLANCGSTLPSGVYELNLDDSLTFFASSPAPDSINGNVYYWSFDTLYYFTEQDIEVQLIQPNFLSLGDTLNSTLTVYSLDNLNNVLFTDSTNYSEILLCAYDPNDKISDPIGIDSLGYIHPDTQFIEYTIRFQNTGNDTASVVEIIDYLDSNLYWNSITPLASSHDYQLSYVQNGGVSFTFTDINLPDSSTNLLESQGFVKYRIEIDSIAPLGTQVYNTGYIYFDQNPAVVTNTKILTIYDCETSFEPLVNLAPICENTYLQIPQEFSSSQYSWSIGSFDSGSGDSINWQADTTGMFSLYINKQNIFCSTDTTVTIEVLPAQQILDSVYACPGQSVEIFGNFQSQPGIYVDSLQSINGCDSLVKMELLNYPTYLNTLPDAFICSGDSMLIFGEYTNAAGNYYDTLQGG